jgi:hypothetical protein
MPTLQDRPTRFQQDFCLEILSAADNGGWVLRLPASLKAHQPELEQLLGNVFSGRPSSSENLALAQQMSLNWCASKCRQNGLTLEDCLSDGS